MCAGRYSSTWSAWQPGLSPARALESLSFWRQGYPDVAWKLIPGGSIESTMPVKPDEWEANVYRPGGAG